ncbi:MAG TPA: hypothetical protein DIU39_06955 [Flavobacteriales bacterium]|nr:hypothetical protein [Flavobacteriales bacterium]|tara:strand:+ start:35949 stop:36530 length:582 start_codon:yes stop_codon:yes gene_type:complete
MNKFTYKRLFSYFLQGLLYILPIGLTVYIIIELFVLLESLNPFDTPGLGLILMLIVITLIGYFGSLYLSSVFSKFEKWFERVPLIKIIYSSIKDLISAFVGQKKRFTEPVLVKIAPEVEKIGFITCKDLSKIGINEDKVGVYLPFSYAITGNFIIVPAQNIRLLDVPSAEIMKYIISGGVTEIELKVKQKEDK